MNNSEIISALTGRVQFRDMFQTKDYIPLDSALTSNSNASGLFVNSISEVYLRPEVIDSYLEFAEGFNVDVWDNATNYGQTGGIIVTKQINGKDQAFVAKASGTDNLNQDPETSTTFWETFLSFRLKQYEASAIQELVNEVTTVKQLSSNTPVLKNYDRLWYPQATPQDLQINAGFRCLNIIPSGTNSIELEISEIGLVTDTAQTISFYLYHSDSTTALKQFDVTIAAGEVDQFVWKQLSDTVDSETIKISQPGTVNSGGTYLFGFYEDDVTGNIKSWEFNYWLAPRIPSHSINYLVWRAYKPYYSFYPNVYNNTSSKPSIPDIGQYFDQGNFDEEIPFNLKLSIRENHSQLIIDNISRLDKALQLKYAILILTDMVHTFRKNSHADKASDIEKILNKSQATEGTQGSFTETVNEGIISKYKLELKSLKTDLISLTENNFGLVKVY